MNTVQNQHQQQSLNTSKTPLKNQILTESERQLQRNLSHVLKTIEDFPKINCASCLNACRPLLSGARDAETRYELLFCNKCKKENYAIKCGTCPNFVVSLIKNKMAPGTIIHCQNELCKREFQYLTCPNSKCRKVNYLASNIRMGNLINCTYCTVSFYYAICNLCLTENYFKKEKPYQPGIETTCRGCKKQFLQFFCPVCTNPTYTDAAEYDLKRTVMKCDHCYASFNLIAQNDGLRAQPNRYSKESEKKKNTGEVEPSQESEEQKITVSVEQSRKKEETIQAFDQTMIINPNSSQSVSTQVLKAIKDQTEKNDSLDELVLDQIKFTKFTPEIVKAIEKFKGLKFLYLNDCGLTTLEGFPKLPSLLRCEITDNKIPGRSLTHITGSTELQSLSLGGNPINSIEDLKTLTSLSKIVQLDLFGCPVSEQADYREKVFGLFSGLQILDNKDADGEEVKYDEEEDEEDEIDDDLDEIEDEGDETEGEGGETEGEGDETELKEEQKQQGTIIDRLKEKIQKNQNQLTEAKNERVTISLQPKFPREKIMAEVKARATYNNRSEGRCWGCGGGPGHTWSRFCRGYY